MAKETYAEAPPRNAFLGKIADLLTQARAPDPKIGPTQNSNIASLLIPESIPEFLDGLSYGDDLTTGEGMTTQLKPEVLGAAADMAEYVPAGKAAAGASSLAGLVPPAVMAALRGVGNSRGLRMFHGTVQSDHQNPLDLMNVENWKKRPEGTHLGSFRAATERIADKLGPGGPQSATSSKFPLPATTIYPIDFKAHTPGYTEDIGSGWEKEIEKAQKQGFDSLFYENRYEDQGSLAVIPFDNQQVQWASGAATPDAESARSRIQQALVDENRYQFNKMYGPLPGKPHSGEEYDKALEKIAKFYDFEYSMPYKPPEAFDISKALQQLEKPGLSSSVQGIKLEQELANMGYEYDLPPGAPAGILMKDGRPVPLGIAEPYALHILNKLDLIFNK